MEYHLGPTHELQQPRRQRPAHDLKRKIAFVRLACRRDDFHHVTRTRKLSRQHKTYLFDTSDARIKKMRGKQDSHRTPRRTGLLPTKSNIPPEPLPERLYSAKISQALWIGRFSG